MTKRAPIWFESFESSNQPTIMGHMKTLVYVTPVDNAEELVARRAVAAGEIRDMHGIFQKPRKSMRRRCEACIEVGG
ncbi:hypothetical protein AVEN_137215-1 [Araneus ventricosus]|uniref:Uncharacterized protein n=1 Tax=Araneus ventricosus TaxID=182803 RepID=A0A4Y2ITW2_ARAVE|nr:hypothetical protein AVEN_137215-1 [Araneus ventricosus]